MKNLADLADMCPTMQNINDSLTKNLSAVSVHCTEMMILGSYSTTIVMF